MATILIVEDSQDNRELLDYIFNSRHKVLAAENGHQAIELFLQYQPDIIITDLNMPEMDGYDLVKFVRANDAKTKIVAFSGSFESVFMKTKMISIGADLCIKTPLDVDQLAEIVNDLAN